MLAATTNGKAQKEQFPARAQAMSVRMHQMAERIQELTRLARQSTMFEDNSAHINQLTAQVKTGLQGLVRLCACIACFDTRNWPAAPCMCAPSNHLFAVNADIKA